MLGSLFTRRSAVRSSSHKPSRPRLEVVSLEDRLVPAVTFSLVQSVLGGQGLIIRGTDKRDVVTINDDGTSNVGNVTVNGDVINAQVSEILFLGKNGDDNLAYNLNGDLAAPRTLNVNLDRGNDRFTANLNGNMVATPEGNLFNNGLAIIASGQQGVDNLRVFADQTTVLNDVDIPATTFLNVRLDGGGDGDTLRVRHSGEVDGNLRVEATGGFGDDVIQIECLLLEGSTGNYGTSDDTNIADGRAGADNLRHVVRNRGNAVVFAVIDGGIGKDKGQRTSNVTPKSLATDAVVN